MAGHKKIETLPRRIARGDVHADCHAIVAINLIGKIANGGDEAGEIDGLVIGARQFRVEP